MDRKFRRMKIILFGGAEISEGQVVPELRLIGKSIRAMKPKQVLHIPFARTDASEEEWAGDYFNKHMKLPGVKYLNANSKSDIAKAKSPLIFISGGRQKLNLIKKIKADKRLLSLVVNASCIVGESAGGTVLGKYCRVVGRDGKYTMAKGLNIIKDTVIEPHYFAQKRQPLLKNDLKHKGLKYGIGVDSMAGIEFDVDEFPRNYKLLGSGLVEIKVKK